MNRFCDYDEGYTKADAEDFGWCRNCTISSCRNCKYYGSYGKGMKNAMYMTPNDYTTIIAKKDAEIKRLKKIVAEVTENINVVGKQNTRLKRKCDRYEKKLTELYLHGILSKQIKGGSMMNLRNVIGATEFKQRVKAKLMQNNTDIKENDLYFSQTTRGYYMEYKPNYPERSNGDFIICQDLNGKISVHGNFEALIPTVNHYEDIDDFENRL